MPGTISTHHSANWTIAHEHVLRALDRICNDGGYATSRKRVLPRQRRPPQNVFEHVGICSLFVTLGPRRGPSRRRPVRETAGGGPGSLVRHSHRGGGARGKLLDRLASLDARHIAEDTRQRGSFCAARVTYDSIKSLLCIAAADKLRRASRARWATCCGESTATSATNTTTLSDAVAMTPITTMRSRLRDILTHLSLGKFEMSGESAGSPVKALSG